MSVYRLFANPAWLAPLAIFTYVLCVLLALWYAPLRALSEAQMRQYKVLAAVVLVGFGAIIAAAYIAWHQ
jgi:hypothetical protein